MLNKNAIKGKGGLRKFITAVAVVTAMSTATVPVFAAEPTPQTAQQGQNAKAVVSAFMQANAQVLMESIMAGDTTYFNIVKYMEANPDVVAAAQGDITNVIMHYLTFGSTEGRSSMGKIDLVAAIVSHPECVTGDALDIASVVTNFATVTGQAIETVTTEGIIIGSTADGSLGVAKVVPGSPAAATTKATVGMTFTGGAATNKATNAGGIQTSPSSTSGGSGSSHKSSGGSDSSSSSSSSSKMTYDKWVAACPTVSEDMTQDEYSSLVESWLAAGMAYGYSVDGAWFEMDRYVSDAAGWLGNMPQKDAYLAETTYAEDHAAWEAGIPQREDFMYDARAYKEAMDAYLVSNPEPSEETYLAGTNYASDHEMWENGKPEESSYVYYADGYASMEQAQRAHDVAMQTFMGQFGDYNLNLPAFVASCENPGEEPTYDGYESADAATQAFNTAMAGFYDNVVSDAGYTAWAGGAGSETVAGLESNEAKAQAYMAYLEENDTGALATLKEAKPDAEDYQFDSEGYAQFQTKHDEWTEAQAAFDAYRQYQDEMIQYRSDLESYMGDPEKEWKKHLTAGGSEEELPNVEDFTSKVNTYESEEDAEEAYQDALAEYIQSNPEPDRSAYLTEAGFDAALEAWLSNMPKKSAFYGQKDADDTTGFSAATDRWNSGKPVIDEFCNNPEDAETINSFNEAHGTWESIMNKLISSADGAANKWTIDGVDYTSEEEATTALEAWKEAQAANAAIQASTLEDYKTGVVYVFGGFTYEVAEEAEEAFATFKETQDGYAAELAKVLDDYKGSVDTYAFGDHQFDQTAENAATVFAEWVAEQENNIAIADDTIADYAGYVVCVDGRYFDADDTEGIREAVDAHNQEYPDDQITTPAPEAGWIIGDNVTINEEEANSLLAGYKSEHEVDSAYASAKESAGEEAVTIDAFASTRENWTINGIDYDTSEEAESAMGTYHETIEANAVDGWTGTETYETFEQGVYAVGDDANLDEEAATEALAAYKENHTVTEGYESKEVADTVTGHETVYKIEGSKTEYATEEEAEAARSEEAGDEPVLSGVTGADEYNEALNNWKEEEPDQSDYKYSDFDEEGYQEAVENNGEEPTEDDYLDDTSYDSDTEDWKADKPEKEDYKVEDADEDGSEDSDENNNSDSNSDADSNGDEDNNSGSGSGSDSGSGSGSGSGSDSGSDSGSGSGSDSSSDSGSGSGSDSSSSDAGE